MQTKTITGKSRVMGAISREEQVQRPKTRRKQTNKTEGQHSWHLLSGSTTLEMRSELGEVRNGRRAPGQGFLLRVGCVYVIEKVSKIPQLNPE